METNIPDEIITEILSWLPVKSLCMFKIVCKSWHSLISSKFFVQKHTQNQIITYYKNNYLGDIMRDDHRWEVPKTLLHSFKTNVTIRGRLRRKYTACHYIEAIDNDPMRYSNCFLIGGMDGRHEPGKYVASLFKDYGNEKLQAFKNETQVVNCPFLHNKGEYSRIIGSCNGLICIYNHIDEIALWNPTIGDLKVVPPSKLKRPQTKFREFCEVGFGFDPCTNDYKVVQILFQKSDPHLAPYQMEIYSLSTNSWRKFDHSTIPGRFRYHLESYYNSMVHKNEIFCWSSLSKRKPSLPLSYEENVVLWFDMRDEVFRTTPFPQHSLLKYLMTLKMCPLHDSISLIFYYDHDIWIHSADKTIEIWSIMDLHDKDSWTKLLNICPLSKAVVRPLGFWNNGEFMILKNKANELLLYSFRRRKFMTMGIERHCWFPYLTSCIETLVSVNGYSSV